MAKQLDVFSGGQVIATALHTEMQQSYLEYAMSVIVGRALPDVRDGLKPVHRRILYAMHELGLVPDRPYRKCARVVGDVLGKYHPHGDQSVYDALVRLVQEFSSRYPLLGGHGNFGSVDDDPPAAMRYTETRLAPIGNEALLTEIGDATVDFIGNFDNSQQEPTVLPAQLPMLLLNGSSGIAVGMATNIPPHNLGEVVDGLIALIDNPTLPDEKLVQLIPGPDFPTGGEIIDTQGIWEAYTTGKGSVPVRGVSRFEEVPFGRGRNRRTAIIVTELPFQVNKAGWIEKMADLVNQGKLEGIADLRDESDRDGIRVVIELKRDTNPQRVLNALYRQTALQSNFGITMLALDHGLPRQMPLRDMLQCFIAFREETLTRRYQHQLTEAENRHHILQGLLTALENLDAVIDILRSAPDGSTAKAEFQQRLNLSDRQSDAILAMPLRRLTGIEREKLQTEAKELTAEMAGLQTLLGDRHELLKSLKKDLRSLKKKFGDPRRTKILAIGNQAPTEEPVEVKSRDSAGKKSPTPESSLPTSYASLEETEVTETVLELTQRGYVRRITPKVFQRQSRNRTGDTSSVTLIELDDFTVQTQFTTTAKELIALTRSGKAYVTRVEDVPQATARSKGAPLITLLPAAAQNDPAGVVGSFILPDDREGKNLLIVTQQGRVKRLPLEDFVGLTGRGLTALKLKEADQIASITIAQPGEQLVIAASSGRMVRVEVNDDYLPMQSRTAQGQLVMRLGKRERLVGAATASQGGVLLLTTERGYAKRMPIAMLRLSTPGELGAYGMQFKIKTDALAGLAAVRSETEVILLTNQDRMVRLDLAAVPMQGRDTAGDLILDLDQNEKIETLIAIPVPATGSDGES
ncbi:DNA topoisomerase 4 subunit A [Phormidium sp. CLA17]|uniref:DNA gyrase/topoisomerase IV subunit A n=1 Tax=Leptolyngbya sp. Cla-17 TaxID=2803751 RepID=UPI0014930451|nr:DNA topoisomerase (ATP-hydrolyzing) [Leptolyngbya sp. Cla-17]MBM0740062.1 DNA topoisomerase 4 subunit A [Leptolyngbya sp. Cla-17]